MNPYTPTHCESGTLAVDNRMSAAKEAKHALEMNHEWQHHRFIRHLGEQPSFAGVTRPPAACSRWESNSDKRGLQWDEGTDPCVHSVCTQNRQICVRCNSLHPSSAVECRCRGWPVPSQMHLSETNESGLQLTITLQKSASSLSALHDGSAPPRLGQFIKEAWDWEKNK